MPFVAFCAVSKVLTAIFGIEQTTGRNRPSWVMSSWPSSGVCVTTWLDALPLYRSIGTFVLTSVDQISSPGGIPYCEVLLQPSSKYLRGIGFFLPRRRYRRRPRCELFVPPRSIFIVSVLARSVRNPASWSTSSGVRRCSCHIIAIHGTDAVGLI